MQNDLRIFEAIIRQDFSSFIRKVFSTINPGMEYHSNWHIDLIAEYLEAARSKQIKRLIINMPPRSLKSVCISVAWPAWILAQKPESRIMAASYSSVLSVKHSLDTKLVLESEWYKYIFPNTKISKKHNCKNKFLTSENGFRFATSVGGSATGEGWDYLIVDDPHNPTQINSKKIKHRAIEWFEQTFVTRLNDRKNGVIVVVMQRLHEEDLSSQLLSCGGWELLKIPMVAPQNIAYNIGTKNYAFQQGEILNSKRDSFEFVAKIEKDMGVRNYAAQFLQDPLPSNYNLLAEEDISFYEQIPGKVDYFIHSWDTAIKTTEKSDFSVGTCWGVVDGRYYLVSMIRKKLAYPDLKHNIERFAKRFSPKYILIEDKASGQSIIQDLQFLDYTNIKAIKPKIDKVTRFASIIDLFQSGKVLLPKESSFNRSLIHELTSFSNSKNDDIVDSVSQFLNFSKEINCKKVVRVRSI